MQNYLSNNLVKPHLLTVDQYHPQETACKKIKKSYLTIFEKIAKK